MLDLLWAVAPLLTTTTITSTQQLLPSNLPERRAGTLVKLSTTENIYERQLRNIHSITPPFH